MFVRFRWPGILPILGALTTLISTTTGPLLPGAAAQQARGANAGVYTDAQAVRGRTLYQQQCAACHGEALLGLNGPPLTGSVFTSTWGGQTLWALASKIKVTMPLEDAGKLTPAQSADLVAFLLQTSKVPAGQAELGSDEKTLKAILLPGGSPQTTSNTTMFPPAGNMAQLMRGMLFPSSNLIFNVQTNDPSAPVKPGQVGAGATTSFSWADWGAGIYKGWEIVDYAAVTVAESAPLMLTPGRRCENGRLVPVDRPDWIKFSQELAEAGRAAYKASQTRNQEAVSDASNQMADACLHCHEVYRDHPGGKGPDPSNKASRCLPRP